MERAAVHSGLHQGQSRTAKGPPAGFGAREHHKARHPLPCSSQTQSSVPMEQIPTKDQALLKCTPNPSFWQWLRSQSPFSCSGSPPSPLLFSNVFLSPWCLCCCLEHTRQGMAPPQGLCTYCLSNLRHSVSRYSIGSIRTQNRRVVKYSLPKVKIK